MNQRYKRRDANASEIVKGLRRVGATVVDLGDVGGGVPDLLVGYRGTNYLVEVKDGAKPPSARKLTPDEETFFETWRGTMFVAESLDDALLGIGAVRSISVYSS